MIGKFSRERGKLSPRSSIKFLEGTNKTGPWDMRKYSVNLEGFYDLDSRRAC